MDYALLVLGLHRADGGSTTDIHTGSSPNVGYAVSPFGDRTHTIRRPFPLTTVYIEAFRNINIDLLSQDGHFLGTWHNQKTGESVLDVVQIFENLWDAIRVGLESGQDAIYDLARNVEIHLTQETS